MTSDQYDNKTLETKCDNLTNQLAEAITERSVFAFKAGQQYAELLTKNWKLKEIVAELLTFTHQSSPEEDVNEYPLNCVYTVCRACYQKLDSHNKHCPIERIQKEIQDL